jgi:hypothetical protein
VVEPDGTAQVAVFVDFENLVLGAAKELPGEANPAPYEAITRLCRTYGNASVRRAYADWADPRFGSHQDDLAMNGVDLIQVARVGIQNKNAADIRMAVDAMETLIVHPEVSVFVLVSGDGDYSPLVQRLREFGKWVVGVGTEANASRKLVSVCSEYKYWGTLVAEVEPAARPAAAFDIAEAEQLLVRAFEESGAATLTAGGLKSKMLALDPAFDEHNYGARSFRAFLAMLPKRVQVVEAEGPDITVKLIDEPRANTARTRSRRSRDLPGRLRHAVDGAGRDRGRGAVRYGCPATVPSTAKSSSTTPGILIIPNGPWCECICPDVRMRQYGNRLAPGALRQEAAAEVVAMGQDGADPVIELDRRGIDLLKSWARPCTHFRVIAQPDGSLVLHPMSAREAELWRSGLVDEIIKNFAHPERMIRLKPDKL